jgi:TIR domain-containing protein
VAEFGLYLVALVVPAVALVLVRWRRPRRRYEQQQQQSRPPDDLESWHYEITGPELEVAVDTQALAAKAPPRVSTGDDVDVSAFSPPRAARGEDFLVQVLAHRPDQEQVARALAAEADPDTTRRGVRSLAVPIELGAALDVQLSMPGLLVDQPVQQLRWADRAEAVQFVVSVPDDLGDDGVIGSVTVSQQGIPIGSLRWRQPIDRAPTESEEQEPQGQWVTRYRKAFISYATRDRPEVLKRVQLLGTLGIDFFQDVLSLDPGQRWEQELYRQIEECDLFLLFWSTAAKESDWVRKEALEALRLAVASGESERPTVGPVLIEGPPVPLPWPELAHLHFNDKLLYLMNG